MGTSRGMESESWLVEEAWRQHEVLARYSFMETRPCYHLDLELDMPVFWDLIDY